MAGSGLIGIAAEHGETFTAAGTASDRAYGVSERLAHDIVFDGEAAGSPGWSYAGATLSLTRSGGADPGDRFGATGTLSALSEGCPLAVCGVRVGTVTRNSGGRLFLTFSGANATEDYVDAVLRQIIYSSLAPPPDAAITLHWVFAQGAPDAPETGGSLIAEGRTLVTVHGAPIWRARRRSA